MVERREREIETLINIINHKGYVLRKIQNKHATSFGTADLIIIENSVHRITFITNVLHGINYFHIMQVKVLSSGRVFKSPRYHKKYISIVSEINGHTYTETNVIPF